jgi:hypothetical protein
MYPRISVDRACEIRGAILTVSLVIIDDKARDEILEFFTRRLAS